MTRSIHIYRACGDDPDVTDHRTDGPECWCRLQLKVVCPVCDGEDGAHCWRCDDAGLVEATAFDSDTESVIVIHEDTTGLPVPEDWPY